MMGYGSEKSGRKTGRGDWGRTGCEGRKDTGLDIERSGDLYFGLVGAGGAVVSGWIDGIVEVVSD